VLSSFELLEPTTVQEAAGLLERYGDEARVYAGGAELILLMRYGLVDATYLVNVKTISGLGGLVAGEDALRVGSIVTHRALELDAAVRKGWPLLAAAESHVGNIRVRSQGTLGGNLCFADPHADPPTALLVYEASVTIEGSGGSSWLPLSEFLRGTYETALQPAELLVEIEVPRLPSGWTAAFARTERFYRPTANAAVAIDLRAGAIAGARLAVGCVGPTAMRLPQLESELAGLTPAEAGRRVMDARAYLSRQLDPVDDLLGSAEYKSYIAGVLLARAIGQAAGTEGANGHG